jgi:NhaP-type Na+/H+ or K+/H+ antiporter
VLPLLHACSAVLLCTGGRHITNRIKVEMHTFWNVLEWLANTMLFIWVGIALGFVLLEPSSPQLQTEVKFSHWIRPADAGYAVVLYLWLLVGFGWWLGGLEGSGSTCGCW